MLHCSLAMNSKQMSALRNIVDDNDKYLQFLRCVEIAVVVIIVIIIRLSSSWNASNSAYSHFSIVWSVIRHICAPCLNHLTYLDARYTSGVQGHYMYVLHSGVICL